MSDLFQRLIARARAELDLVKPVLGPRFGPVPELPEDTLAELEEELGLPEAEEATEPPESEQAPAGSEGGGPSGESESKPPAPDAESPPAEPAAPGEPTSARADVDAPSEEIASSPMADEAEFETGFEAEPPAVRAGESAAPSSGGERGPAQRSEVYRRVDPAPRQPPPRHTAGEDPRPPGSDLGPSADVETTSGNQVKAASRIGREEAALEEAEEPAAGDFAVEASQRREGEERSPSEPVDEIPSLSDVELRPPAAASGESIESGAAGSDPRQVEGSRGDSSGPGRATPPGISAAAEDAVPRRRAEVADTGETGVVATPGGGEQVLPATGDVKAEELAGAEESGPEATPREGMGDRPIQRLADVPEPSRRAGESAGRSPVDVDRDRRTAVERDLGVSGFGDEPSASKAAPSRPPSSPISEPAAGTGAAGTGLGDRRLVDSEFEQPAGEPTRHGIEDSTAPDAGAGRTTGGPVASEGASQPLWRSRSATPTEAMADRPIQRRVDDPESAREVGEEVGQVPGALDRDRRTAVDRDLGVSEVGTESPPTEAAPSRPPSSPTSEPATATRPAGTHSGDRRLVDSEFEQPAGEPTRHGIEASTATAPGAARTVDGPTVSESESQRLRRSRSATPTEAMADRPIQRRVDDPESAREVGGEVGQVPDALDRDRRAAAERDRGASEVGDEPSATEAVPLRSPSSPTSEPAAATGAAGTGSGDRPVVDPESEQPPRDRARVGVVDEGAVTDGRRVEESSTGGPELARTVGVERPPGAGATEPAEEPGVRPPSTGEQAPTARQDDVEGPVTARSEEAGQPLEQRPGSPVGERRPTYEPVTAAEEGGTEGTVSGELEAPGPDEGTTADTIRQEFLPATPEGPAETPSGSEIEARSVPASESAAQEAAAHDVPVQRSVTEPAVESAAGRPDEPVPAGPGPARPAADEASRAAVRTEAPTLQADRERSPAAESLPPTRRRGDAAAARRPGSSQVVSEGHIQPRAVGTDHEGGARETGAESPERRTEQPARASREQDPEGEGRGRPTEERLRAPVEPSRPTGEPAAAAVEGDSHDAASGDTGQTAGASSTALPSDPESATRRASTIVEGIGQEAQPPTSRGPSEAATGTGTEARSVPKPQPAIPQAVGRDVPVQRVVEPEPGSEPGGPPTRSESPGEEAAAATSRPPIETATGPDAESAPVPSPDTAASKEAVPHSPLQRRVAEAAPDSARSAAPGSISLTGDQRGGESTARGPGAVEDPTAPSSEVDSEASSAQAPSLRRRTDPTGDGRETPEDRLDEVSVDGRRPGEGSLATAETGFSEGAVASDDSVDGVARVGLEEPGRPLSPVESTIRDGAIQRRAAGYESERTIDRARAEPGGERPPGASASEAQPTLPREAARPTPEEAPDVPIRRAAALPRERRGLATEPPPARPPLEPTHDRVAESAPDGSTAAAEGWYPVPTAVKIPLRRHDLLEHRKRQPAVLPPWSDTVAATPTVEKIRVPRMPGLTAGGASGHSPVQGPPRPAETARPERAAQRAAEKPPSADGRPPRADRQPLTEVTQGPSLPTVPPRRESIEDALAEWFATPSAGADPPLSAARLRPREQPEAAPSVTVNIGSIEVRPEAPEVESEPPPPFQPRLSLSEYLSRRRAGLR